MKKFEDLLGYTQEQLKQYLSSYLCGIGYKINTGDGYLFAKGEVPVLLIAHMDTARKEIPKEIVKAQYYNGVSLETRVSATDSLVGGDDRCGCWMIMNIIKKVKCWVLFVEDEECGCVGARKFTKSQFINDVKENISFMIELDRRGRNDCVFYSNDNKEFIKYIEEKTGTKEAVGSMSDISTLMPESKVAGVNFSCGYYNEHTKSEYVVVEEMNDIMERIIKFLESETEFQKYEYVAKKYLTYPRTSDWWKLDDYDMGYTKPKRSFSQTQALKTMSELCLTVTLDPEYFDGEDMELEAFGSSVPECWANLFIENEDLSFSMIDDYFFH